MGRGRISKVEQARRMKLLIDFIFVFRYATRYQLFEFGRNVIGLTNPRWLVDYACNKGLVRSYLVPPFKVKIYHLTTKGEGLIEGIRIKPYRFERRLTHLNAVTKHRILVDVYLTCSRYLDAQLTYWETRWLLRIGKRRRETIPDGAFSLPCGIKVAVSIELHYKRIDFFKSMVSIYRYYIEKIYTYHALLIVASHRRYCESLKRRLTRISPFFCQKSVIFTNPEMLKQGMCFYNNEEMELNDAIELMRAKSVVVSR